MIMLGGSKSTLTSNGVISCDLAIPNELTNSKLILTCLRFRVIDSVFDIILGLPTIKVFDLTHKLRSLFIERPIDDHLSRPGNIAMVQSEMSPHNSDFQISLEPVIKLVETSNYPVQMFARDLGN